MYSGTTFTNFSGSIVGAHQKIDRVAYAHLRKIIPMKGFPSLRQVLHFEGKNGPDGIKRKSPARDEPWHFYNPFDDEDTVLLEHIKRHYSELVSELKKQNTDRAAFNAAWLAHALVDGLTPAHHFPYEEKLSELRGGESKESRNTIKDKLIIPGENVPDRIKKNWAMWGKGGVLSTHVAFEMGVAVMMAPLKFPKNVPTDANLKKLNEIGFIEWFERAAREIALLDMYDRFTEQGWTVKLARQVRNELAPVIIKTVCLAWYSAAREAGLLKGKR